MKVTKRNGVEQVFDFDKIKTIFDIVKDDLTTWEDFIGGFKKYTVDGIATKDIMKMLIKTATDLITLENTKWALVAGRLVIRNLYKEATKNHGVSTEKLYSPERFLWLVREYQRLGLYSDKFSIYEDEEILEAGKNIIPSIDMSYGYTTAIMYSKRYLNNKNGVVLELPQHMYMAIALFLAIPESKETRISFANKIYKACATGEISLPTPTLLNARTNFHQLSSCFKFSLDDDLRGIYHSIENMAQVSKFGGGIGSYFGHIRSKGASIRGTKGASGGVMPWVKVANDTAIAVNQLGCVEKDSFVKRLNKIKFTHSIYGDLEIDIGKMKQETYLVNNRFTNIDCIIKKLGITHKGIDNKTIGDILVEYSKGEHREILSKKYNIPVHIMKRIITKLNKIGLIPDGYIELIDFPGYAINKFGDIIALNKGLQSLYRFKNNKGYIYGAIGKSSYTIHRLIYKTFVGEIPDGFTVDHIDNNKENNHYSNLQLLSIVDNIKKRQDDLSIEELEKINCNIRIKALLNQGKNINGYRTIGKEINNIKFEYQNDYIYNIRKGDYVASYNGKNVIPNLVLNSYPVIVTSENQIRIFYEDGNYITTSLWHPLGIIEDEKLIYKRSDEIKIGEVSINSDGELTKITNIEKGNLVDKNYRDLEINNVNNYFCSSKKEHGGYYLTHNSRAGAISVTLDVFHRDIQEWLDMQTETGDIRRKAFDVFPAIAIPDLFMKRVKENEKWTMFDPHEIYSVTNERLEDKFGDEFESFYNECESNANIKLRDRINAKDLFLKILKTQVETGMPYVFFRDTANRNNPNKHNGSVYASNLCCEIIQNMSSPKFIKETNNKEGKINIEYNSGDNVVCNLASINVAKVNTIEKAKEIIPIVTRLLDNVITLNYYPIEEARITSEKYRPIGIGFMGLAQYFAENKIIYGSPESVKETDRLFSMLSLIGLKSSVELAKEKGAYELFKGSERSKGIFQGKDLIDLYGDEGITLKEEMIKYGTRFGYHFAPAPNTSTALVIGTTAGLLPVYKRYFIETNSVSPMINIAPNLSSDNFFFYQEYINMDMSKVIDVISTAQKYIDQSISCEFLINPAKVSPKDLYGYIFKAWSTGMKTIYYIRSMSIEANSCESCSG